MGKTLLDGNILTLILIDLHLEKNSHLVETHLHN